MARDLDEEIRKLRQEIGYIDNAIAYFERLEAERAVTNKRLAKAESQKSATLVQMRRKAGSERS